MPEASARATVLVVDDEPIILETISFALEQAGYTCLQATNGGDAIRIAREAHPDLILLDVMMPLLNGFHVCQILKSDKGLAGVTIIMITARTEERDYAHGKQMGADDYLTKPFEMADLLTIVARHLGSPS